MQKKLGFHQTKWIWTKSTLNSKFNYFLVLRHWAHDKNWFRWDQQLLASNLGLLSHETTAGPPKLKRKTKLVSSFLLSRSDFFSSIRKSSRPNFEIRYWFFLSSFWPNKDCICWWDFSLSLTHAHTHTNKQPPPFSLLCLTHAPILMSLSLTFSLSLTHTSSHSHCLSLTFSLSF